jgi:hypothetical protein
MCTEIFTIRLIEIGKLGVPNMRRRSNNSLIEELLEQFWDLTLYIWQVGLTITILFAFLTIKSFLWIQGIEKSFAGKPMEALFQELYWLFYLVPIAGLTLTIVFGKRTYSSYRK